MAADTTEKMDDWMTGCYGYILELASHAQCVSIVSCIYYVCVPQMCTYTFF